MPPPSGHCESQSLSPKSRDVAFSPEDWKESFKTSFGFIFQRPGLGILRPEDVAWRGEFGGRQRGRERLKGLAPTLACPQPQK